MAKTRRRGRARDQGWQVLQACVSRNVVVENNEYSTRVATTGPRDNYGEYGSPQATFEFRDGKWYWVGFSFGAGH